MKDPKAPDTSTDVDQFADEDTKAITKRDLAESVARTVGISNKAAYQTVSATFALLQQKLADGFDVAIVGFGTFYTSHCASRVGRNIRTGAQI